MSRYIKILKEEFIKLIDEGCSIKEIALKLNICEATVKNKLKIFELKTNCKRRFDFKYKFPDSLLIETYKKSDSLNQFLKNLNVQYSGGAFYHYKKRLIKLGVDLRVWSNINKAEKGGKANALIRNTNAIQRKVRLPRPCLKKHMDTHNVKEICISCGIDSWLNQKLKLHIHHKDHDKTNNNINNLEYKCPNCHSIEHYNT